MFQQAYHIADVLYPPAADGSDPMADRLDELFRPVAGTGFSPSPRVLLAPMTQRPLCFVLMPFGTKPAAGGATIDFDTVYKELIVSAIEQAGLEPLRADEEMTGGVIHMA
jgi:hypothetical protein